MMYKIVVFWRWDKGKQSADCFWCVPWPEDFDIEGEVAMMTATYTLTYGTPPKRPYNDMDALRNAGFPEAASMLHGIAITNLRARFNQMEEEIFDSEVPLTREQIEQIKLNRRET